MWKNSFTLISHAHKELVSSSVAAGNRVAGKASSIATSLSPTPASMSMVSVGYISTANGGGEQGLRGSLPS